MTIETVNIKSQMKKHIALGKTNATLALAIHVAACEDLQHASLHGDVTLCQHLYESLGGQKSAARTATLKAWFVKYSGGMITAEKGSWKMKKNWSADKFNLEGAEANPYYADNGEKEQKPMSFAIFMQFVRGFATKIDRAEKSDNFVGDADKIRTIVNGVIDFAEEKAKRLTAQELGTKLTPVPETAITAADSKGQSRGAVIAAKQAERNAESQPAVAELVQDELEAAVG